MDKSQSNGAKVLVVEDDAVSYCIVASSLRLRGFEVVPARDAAEAIAILQKDSDLAAVFSDIVMPGEMDGSTLQAWIRINRPGLPVILGSANPEKASATWLEEFRFFAKPYNMDAIAACLRSLIR